jgi:hypothetical protein
MSTHLTLVVGESDNDKPRVWVNPERMVRYRLREIFDDVFPEGYVEVDSPNEIAPETVTLKMSDDGEDVA